MGHLGLTPQSIYKFGTYVVRAREQEEADRLRADAKLLEEAGCFALVLEKIPPTWPEVAQSVDIPVIGIGAGGGWMVRCSCCTTCWASTAEFNPRFLRRYADLHGTITDAVGRYIEDVRSHEFPNTDEQY